MGLVDEVVVHSITTTTSSTSTRCRQDSNLGLLSVDCRSESISDPGSLGALKHLVLFYSDSFDPSDHRESLSLALQVTKGPPIT